jgi:hypothetical protein
VTVLDVRTNRVLTARPRGRVTAAAFAPRGSAAAYVQRTDGRSALRLLGVREPLIQTSGAYDGLTWSPDARWLLTGWDGRWLLVRRDGRETVLAPGRGRPLGWTR